MDEGAAIVAIVDDDAAVGQALARLLESVGLTARHYASGNEFLTAWTGDEAASDRPACVLLDIRMPGMSGLEVQDRLRECDPDLPIVFLTSYGDVTTAVRALKKGAVDFFEKPGFNREELIERIQQCLRTHAQRLRERGHRRALEQRLARLSRRESEVLEHVVAGLANKQVAAELGISERTVEIHRQRVMQKMEVDSLPELVRSWQEADQCVD